VPGLAQSWKLGQAKPQVPAHNSSKLELAAQAAASVLYYITTIYIYA